MTSKTKNWQKSQKDSTNEKEESQVVQLIIKQLKNSKFSPKALAFENYFQEKNKQSNYDICSLIMGLFDIKPYSNNQKLLLNLKLNQHQKKNKSQSQEQLDSYTANKEFFQSFTQYTRKSHRGLIVLISTYNVLEDQCQVSKRIRAELFSLQGLLIHIYSQISIDNIHKLQKFISTKFSRLSLLTFVALNDLAITQRIADELPQDFKQHLIFIDFTNSKMKNFKVSQTEQCPFLFDREGQAQIQHLTKQVVQEKQCVIYMLKRLDKELKLNLIRKIEKLVQIRCFLQAKVLKPIVFQGRVLYQNIFLSKLYVFYFNLMQVKNFSSPISHLQNQIEQLHQEALKTLVSSLLKYQTAQKEKQSITFCTPSLGQMSKKCIVCRQSKPKFVCSNCSNQFKYDIHLCIEQCFKKFHIDRFFYLSKLQIVDSERMVEILQEQKPLEKKIKTLEVTFEQKTQSYEPFQKRRSIQKFREAQKRLERKNQAFQFQIDGFFRSHQVSTQLFEDCYKYKTIQRQCIGSQLNIQSGLIKFM